MPPEADWMLMASLHDEEDVVADPIIIDPTDEGAPVSEYMEWYRKTGFYTSVTHRDIKSKEDVMAINKTPTNHIILRIWTKLFKPEALDFGRHAIALEDSIIIDSDRIKFRYWTWAQPSKFYEGHINTFLGNCYGAVTAEFKNQ